MQKFDKPKYIDWLIEEVGITFEDGVPLKCYRIDYDMTDTAALSEWATHIRKHYITDDVLAKRCAKLGFTPSEYLKSKTIPQKGQTLAATTISAEIAEILIYDFVEFIMHYKPLRGKHWDKSTPTATVMGSDVLGAKMANPNKPSSSDELIVVEVKAGLSSEEHDPIYKAKRDSDFDTFRYSVTLEFLSKKYEDKHENELLKISDRFQQKANLPFVIKYAGAGIVAEKNLTVPLKQGVPIKKKGKTIANISITFSDNIYVIHGNKLMNLAYDIYGRIIE